MRILAFFLITVFSIVGFAKGGGGHAIGGNLMFVSPGQDDMNTLVKRANAGEPSGISTSALNSAYELNFNYIYRFGGTIWAMVIRPSYFWQVSNGKSNSSGSEYNYQLIGYTLFPMVRIVPLENEYIKFFMQTGLGFGSLDGMIKEADARVRFNGKAFGFVVGLGAEFCFTNNHCMNVEGNFRYLPYERNIATSQSGTFAGNSITQPPTAGGDRSGVEVELDDKDLCTTMSGIQGMLGYTYWF